MKQPPTEALLAYRGLVERYHRTLDLLSDEGLDAWERYVADARAYAAVIARRAPEARTVVDVGSGVGLPGVVLALSAPDLEVVLVERRRRRAAFLTLVRGALGLTHVTVVDGDVRDLRGVRADVVTAQAVAPFRDVYAWTSHLHASQVWLVSRKAAGWPAEVRQLEAACGTAADEVVEEALEPRGSVVALRLPGGRACRSSG